MLERWIARPVWHDPWDVRVRIDSITSTLAMWCTRSQLFIFPLVHVRDTIHIMIPYYCSCANHRSAGTGITKTSLRRYEPLPNNPNDPCPSRTFSSTPGILTRLITKLVVFDTAHYLMQYTRPSLNDPGDTLIDPSLTLIPRYAKAPFLATCGAVVVYTSVGVLYHFATLIGHFLLRQPDWA
jgi:hypothetical protein